jgi:hypothetical protein
MQAKKEMIFYLGKPIDWTKFHVDPPKTNQFTKGTTPIEWITSNIHYCPNGPHGEKLVPYFQLATQTIWGFSGCWNLNEPVKTMDNLEGYQICYPLTTLQTKDELSKDEAATKVVFDGLWQLVVNAMKKFGAMGDEKDPVLPGVALNAYYAAVGQNNWTRAVKPLYEYPNVDENGKKRKDTTKCQRSYIKLETKGKGQKLTCLAKIFGPGDKPVSPTKYLNTNTGGDEQGSSHRGKASIIIKADSIFWGGHGKSSYAASASIRVAQMNYTPITDNGGLKIRVLPRNDDPEDTEGGNEVFAFQDPMGGEELNFDRSAFLSDDSNVNTLLNANVNSEVKVPEPVESPPSSKKKVEEITEKTTKSTPKKGTAKK